MGSIGRYKCNKCGYQVDTTCGLDYGLFAVVDTYVCQNCNEISDIMVGSTGMVIPPEEISKEDEKEFMYYTCECGSKNIVKWDVKKRPCPKCDKGKMIKDKDFLVLWD